jgi:2-keto-4-pentenoate hydratase/2-oxohepta-3-ene-1,7-dioic acid hydratase in catechol pathway
MKIFCVGRNYVAHAKELGNEIPEEPVIFIKPKSALLLNKMPFYYPEFTNELHYEAELVLRVSKNGRYIPENQAMQYVDAVSVGIDFTARDIQTFLKTKGLPWEKAKAFDSSAVVGDFKPMASLKDSKNIKFAMELNGQMVQQGETKNMLFNFNKIISNISQYFSINIGDLIYTGTPEGVGECTVGDELTGYLEGEKIFNLGVR